MRFKKEFDRKKAVSIGATFLLIALSVSAFVFFSSCQSYAYANDNVSENDNPELYTHVKRITDLSKFEITDKLIHDAPQLWLSSSRQNCGLHFVNEGSTFWYDWHGEHKYNMLVSYDRNTWYTWEEKTILDDNKNFYVFYINANYYNVVDRNNYLQFHSTGNFSVEGDLAQISSTYKEKSQGFHNLFRGCKGLTSYKGRMTGICSFTFYECSSLKEVSRIVVGGRDTDTPYLQSQPLEDDKFEATFSQCSSLEKVTFYGYCRTIGNFSFYNTFTGCKALKKIVNALPDDETTPAMGEYNTGLFGNNITVGNSGCAAMFWGCSSLEEVIMPNITKADTGAFVFMFAQCPNLKNLIPKHGKPGDMYYISIKNVPDKCFYLMFFECPNLKQPIFMSIETLGDGSFYHMYGKTGIQISTQGKEEDCFFVCPNFDQDADYNEWPTEGMFFEVDGFPDPYYRPAPGEKFYVKSS